MLYHFPHPGNSQIYYTYNDESTSYLRKTWKGQVEHIPLKVGNINASDFFFYLIKCKIIHLENPKGYAYLGDARIEIAKLYDCKSKIHELLGFTLKNP